MPPIAKLLLTLGTTLGVLGLLVWATQLLPQGLRLFHLPGDIRIEREGFRFYFPITTMVLLSLLATGVLWLARWWRS